jgi:hypothetical protein
MRHLSHRVLLPVLFLCAADAQAEVVTFRSEAQPANLTATIGGVLAFPNGSGPFPVVILLHPCGGLDPIGLATLRAHAKELSNVGFATYILDSYGPRNLSKGKACESFPTGSLRRGDAFNAMAALQRHPKINKENIFLLGLSDGANAALLSAKGGSIGQFRASRLTTRIVKDCWPELATSISHRPSCLSARRTTGHLRPSASNPKARAWSRVQSSRSCLIQTPTTASIRNTRPENIRDTRWHIAVRRRLIAGKGSKSSSSSI